EREQQPTHRHEAGHRRNGPAAPDPIGDERPEHRHQGRPGDRRSENEADLRWIHAQRVEVHAENDGQVPVGECSKDARDEQLLAVDAQPVQHESVATVTRQRSELSSAEVRDLRDRFVPRGLHAGTPVVVASAQGAEIFAAVRAQLDRYAHVSAQVVTYEPYVRLAQELDRIYPRAEGSTVATKSIFANSGAEAVENAIKIARVATGREWVVAFQNSFHGRTYTAMTATGKTKSSRMPFMRSTSPNIAHLPYPYPYRPIANVGEEELAELHVRLFEQALETNLAPEHVAAVILEPIQGEGGFVVPPARFLKRIAAICRRYEIVLIVDEIQTGMARTGRMFAIEHAGVAPDLVITSKSLGAGFPIGAVTGRTELFDAMPSASFGS